MSHALFSLCAHTHYTGSQVYLLFQKKKKRHSLPFSTRAASFQVHRVKKGLRDWLKRTAFPCVVLHLRQTTSQIFIENANGCRRTATADRVASRAHLVYLLCARLWRERLSPKWYVLHVALMFKASHVCCSDLSVNICAVYLIYSSRMMYCMLLNADFIASLHTFLTGGMCSLFRNTVLPRLGCRVSPAFETRAAEIFEKYVMPAAYLLLLAMGLGAAQIILAPRLPELEVYSLQVYDGLCPRSRLFCSMNTAISFPPRSSKYTVYIYAIVALTSWLCVLITDPGTITRDTKNLYANLYPYDNMLFRPNRECYTCHVPRYARSKHCALCNRCVARFDHHCGWVGTCVGLYNTNLFISFLSIHFFMLMHGALVSMEIVRARIQHIIEGNFIYSPTGLPIKNFSFKIALVAEPNVCLVCMVFTLCTLVVGAFLIYHLSLVWRNKTSNETWKWDVLFSACKDLAHEHGGKPLRDIAFEEAREKGPQAITQLPVFRPDGMPANIYNRGVLRNAIEVFVPYLFTRTRRASHATTDAPSTLKKDG